MNVIRILLTLLLALYAAAPASASFDDLGDAGDREPTKQEKQLEKEEELYEEGTDAIDENDWRSAARSFQKVANMNLGRRDAALYWLAYSQNKLGQRAEALAALLDLEKGHPSSRWAKDGKALEVEIRQSSGQKVEPSRDDDDDIKLMALNGLMHSDPERAVVIVENVIKSQTTSPKVKERAIFVLSQSGSPKALEVLGRVAKDGARPELQSKALKYLGIMGGERSRIVLAEVYASSPDLKVKRTVLKSYMIAGDRARLLQLAKSETNADLRADAVTQLGILGARNELSDLYGTEQSTDIRKKIIQAMFIGGHAEKMGEIARTERVPELRMTAIKNLGLMGNSKTGPLLVQLYDTDTNPEVRRTVVKALFLQQNASALVSLARKERDISMKKEIVSKLSLIHSKEAADYLMEYLQQ